MKLLSDFPRGDHGLIFWLIVPGALIFLSWNLLSLFRNYIAARSSRIPSYLSPVNPQSIPWLLLSVSFKSFFQRALPNWLYDRIRPTIYGWEFHSKYNLHEKFGASFILSTPGTNELFIADPEAANDFLKRPKDFIPLPGTDLVAGVFGPNLLTVHGEQWQRQRRLIAPNFNENVSALVWNEARSQAREMLDYFLQGQDGETEEIVSGLRQVAIHIIGEAGYGIRESWKSAFLKSKQVSSPDRMTYVEAVNFNIYHLLQVALLPGWIFSIPFLSESLRHVGTVSKRFEILTAEMLDRERREAKTRETPRKNLMSTLVALSDAGKSEGDKQGPDPSMSLTDEQISGNLFLFTVAGYDTTATTLAYGITTLAQSPHWQEWLYTEIRSTAETADLANYEASFPRLIRCRAYLFETLRLYNPIGHIGRINPFQQTLQTSDGPKIIPAGTHSYINALALQTRPSLWGENVLEFKPTRWLNADGSLKEMQKGIFLPWSAGPRVCPGMKMAQVEFVGVLATLLRGATIEMVTKPDESVESAQKRLWECMQDSQTQTTLQMNRPKDVKLRFVRR